MAMRKSLFIQARDLLAGNSWIIAVVMAKDLIDLCIWVIGILENLFDFLN